MTSDPSKPAEPMATEGDSRSQPESPHIGHARLAAWASLFLVTCALWAGRLIPDELPGFVQPLTVLAVSAAAFAAGVLALSLRRGTRAPGASFTAWVGILFSAPFLFTILLGHAPVLLLILIPLGFVLFGALRRSFKEASAAAGEAGRGKSTASPLVLLGYLGCFSLLFGSCGTFFYQDVVPGLRDPTNQRIRNVSTTRPPTDPVYVSLLEVGCLQVAVQDNAPLISLLEQLEREGVLSEIGLGEAEVVNCVVPVELRDDICGRIARAYFEGAAEPGEEVAILVSTYSASDTGGIEIETGAMVCMGVHDRSGERIRERADTFFTWKGAEPTGGQLDKSDSSLWITAEAR